MKTNASGLSALICLTSTLAFSQGSLVFDQQSATGGLATGGSRIQNQQPMGQSFKPAANYVGFVQFQFGDFIGNQGAWVYVNMAEDSISGTVVAVTPAVFLPNNFLGTTTFLFGSNVLVQPEKEYFFIPTLRSGDNVDVLSGQYNYLRGTAIFSGQPSSAGLDFWFREGYVVPESSTLCLGVLGAGLLLLGRHCRRR